MQSCTFSINHHVGRTFNLKNGSVPEQWVTAFVRLENICQRNEEKKEENSQGKGTSRKKDDSKKKNSKSDETGEECGMSIHPLTPPQTPVSEKKNKKPRTDDPDQTSWDPNVEYEIEKILHHKMLEKRMMYLVKWKGWSDAYNTYEPIENLTNCNYLLMKYLERSKPDPKPLKKLLDVIMEEMHKHEMYPHLSLYNSCRKALKKFSETGIHIKPIWTANCDLNSFKNRLVEEYGYVVRCLAALGVEKDVALLARAVNYRIAIELVDLRHQQLVTLSEAKRYINILESTEIEIVNEVDLTPFPRFRYVTETENAKDVIIPTDPPLGCHCSTGCTHRSKCCSSMAGSAFAYNSMGTLQIHEGYPIYECNQKCTCSKDCPNRVVQRGRKHRLCIFRTKSCGWGVRAAEKIKRGTFIAEYIGELIGEKEAHARDQEYQRKKMISYLFDLDFNPDRGTETYSIDASRVGNFARFINHSCNPNLVVYPVWVDCLDPNLPRLAFFTKKTINKNEEITFDYENIREDIEPSIKRDDRKNCSGRSPGKLKCQCRAANCRGWLFGNS